MFFKKYIFFLLLILPVITSAQQSEITDSLKITHKDKTVEEANHSIVTYIPPAAFVTWGILSFHVKGIRQIDYNVYNDMQKDHPGFKTHADNYLQYAPAAIVYGLNL